MLVGIALKFYRFIFVRRCNGGENRRAHLQKLGYAAPNGGVLFKGCGCTTYVLCISNFSCGVLWDDYEVFVTLFGGEGVGELIEGRVRRTLERRGL